MNEVEWKILEQVKRWNIAATFFFLALVFVAAESLREKGILLEEISFFDAFLITFSTFQIIRLFVYDNITLFLREWFLDLSIMEKNGVKEYEYIPSANAFKRTGSKLLNCLWCFGMWSGLLVVWGYFALLEWKILFILLAFSGVASFLQLVSNMIGWIAEEKKQRVGKS